LDFQPAQAAGVVVHWKKAPAWRKSSFLNFDDVAFG
jgi:hypothetical protein